MPSYDYRDLETGELVTRIVPISERDEQEGYERILSFRGMTSSTFGGWK